ncbi:hypothetical protein IFM89_013300 [Coptis chinensis]|uniref:fructose-bisphosphate aldolase n=1 Tax=Coptis chinensis TaxID=261450 RepID=A0A835LIE6_9MAGN|nr:hypothetical protein IFM89_013300 [Coptis chinensis]
MPNLFCGGVLVGVKNEEQATINLNAMNQLKGKKPWSLSFSFGRALLQSTLKAWSGKVENVEKTHRLPNGVEEAAHGLKAAPDHYDHLATPSVQRSMKFHLAMTYHHCYPNGVIGDGWYRPPGIPPAFLE